MAQKTTAQVKADIDTYLPTNGLKAINAAAVRTIADEIADSYANRAENAPTPQDYGAVGDGITNDTAAINSWLAAVGTRKVGYIKSGTYKVTSQVIFPVGSGISIFGDGSGSTILSYAGASTTIDPFAIGDGSASLINWTIRGLKFTSQTTMTAGVGVHFKRFCRSTLLDVVIDGQDGTGKFYHGVRFNGLDDVNWSNFEARAAQDAVQVNGLAGANPKADLFLSNFKIAGSTNGIRIGGAFGGLYLGAGAIGANSGDGLIIDTTLVAEANREVFVSPLVAIDANTGRGIIVDQSISAQFFLNIAPGAWVCSNGSHGVYIKNANGAKIDVGAYVYNNTGDGVRIDDASAYVDVNGLFANANGGYGINPTVAASLLNVGKARFVANTSGDFNRTSNTYKAVFAGDFLQNGNDKPFRMQSIAGTLDASGNATLAHGLGSTYYKQVVQIFASAKSTGGAWYPVTVNNMDGTNVSVSQPLGAAFNGQPVWVTFLSNDTIHTNW